MPTPGRSVDEERVVGVAGELGDGQRGGVGEAVGVADDELLEGQRRVDPVLGRARGGRLVPGGPGAGAALGGRARAHVDGDLGSEDRRDAGLQHAREALGDPGAQLARGLDDEDVALEAERLQGREPDVVHVSRDRLAQLVLDGAPDVLGVLGHDRGSRLLGRQRSAADGGGGRPGGDRRGDYSNGLGAERGARRGPLDARRKSRTKPPAGHAHACARRVEGSVDNVRALDWRAGHSTLPLP